MKLIIGLGNPGKEYEGTRHNAGFMAVDALAEELDATWKNDTKRKTLVATAEMNGEKIILAKPQTYMNLSGEAAQALASFYKITPENILIIHDEMDLEPGRIQLKPKGGGAAGHNGVSSVQERLGSTGMARLRIGTGHPEGRIPTEDWVLGELSPEQSPNALDITSVMRDWIEGRIR